MRHSGCFPACTCAELASASSSILLVGCTSATEPGSQPAPSGSQSDGPGSAIQQPHLPPGVQVAPDSERVDLTVPTFSHPTDVTNPLFPVSQQHAVVFVGHVDDLPFRTEVTLLPDTRLIEWGGQRVETLVSQYTAYLDGRIQEVAYDLYAQADDGSVWYFGEDVVDVENGNIVTKEGTWLAGVDGPAQMIMPSDPSPGEVYRTENIPGIAFEQVTVKSVDLQLAGPLGPVRGMVGEELHEDGSTELKQFARGYGEYFTGDRGDVEALALAVPTDASQNPMPPGLAKLYADARTIVREGIDPVVVRRIAADWSGVPRSDTPHLMVPVVTRAVRGVRGAPSPTVARQRAVDLALRALDLQLRYRDPTVVDMERVSLWCDQLRLDAHRRDLAGIRSDVFTLYYLRDRVRASLRADTLAKYNHELGVLQEAAVDHDVPGATRCCPPVAGRGRRRPRRLTSALPFRSAVPHRHEDERLVPAGHVLLADDAEAGAVELEGEHVLLEPGPLEAAYDVVNLSVGHCRGGVALHDPGLVLGVTRVELLAEGLRWAGGAPA